MAEDDRRRWDERYRSRGAVSIHALAPPHFVRPYLDVIPTAGRALDLACGQGLGAVWLACRGLSVWGVDISPVAIEHARVFSALSGVSERCRFDVFDLDDGLPPGPPVDMILCHQFRDRRLDAAVIERLAPGGLLAVCCMSEVGAGSGRFRAKPGELSAAFAELELIGTAEGEGTAWLLSRARTNALEHPPKQ
ncbi:SAM-dependent methyltransferase [Mycobacterium intermedium]|uniref:SAM-dependent methyltransferase n=1 Tax=Mycobacterium intermedium TaxID=28445 RepID=A0A1E3SID8_MYCIE|nr:class I SAM-dependent methyltransferase [Mycobacterium intermedium]MCV6964444.1 class I SAM-dependent methyltransferase [Mycobacterium intermedium]ODR01924.1 SAM-dependent methyltransferase [Mycobacterium intermedium]OPE49453.1 SAM-dependent methyltransferase [Mycobacterium intermedium]ORA93969.1 SAM-dependent methyltransferase [Mycobacterium intermedium]